MTTITPRGSRLLAAVAVAGLTVGGLSISHLPLSYAAPSCTSGVPGDVNGDGYAEVAVGSPERGHGKGAVSVFYGTRDGLVVDAVGSAHDDQYFDQASPGIPGTARTGDVFGSSTAFGDVDGDGCADLLIGAPGDGKSGSLTVLLGGPSGLGTTRVVLYRPDDLLETPGGSFGGPMAVTDLDGDGFTDVAVGMPRGTVAGQRAAGGVAVVFGSANGLGQGHASIVVSQDSPGVPGTAAYGVAFGSSMAAGDFDGDGAANLAVGAPGDINHRGAVQVLHFTTGGLAATQPALLSQDSPGVPGEGGKSDDFSVALAAGDVNGDGRDDLAVGAPRALVDAATQSVGAVYLFPGSAEGLSGAGSQRWTKSSPGVPGKARYTDNFGRSLAIGPLDAGPTDDVVIGDNGAAVGERTYSVGTATVLFGGAAGLTSAGAQLFDQDVPGIAGTAENSDEFGKAVAVAYVQGGTQASLVVGAPGEKIGPRVSAGVITQLPLGPDGPVAVGSRTIDFNTPGVKGKLKREGSGFGRTINGPFGDVI